MYRYDGKRVMNIDDLFQLQSLLSSEQHEREKHIEECQNSPSIVHLHSIYSLTTPSEISFAALAQKKRLDQAIFNIKSLRDEYRRERTRQIQTYFNEYQRQALISAVLHEEEEKYYRQCIAAAIEQRQATNIWNGYLQRQKEEKEDYSQYRSSQLTNLLKQVFGEQKQIEQEDIDKDDALAEVWKCLSEQRQENAQTPADRLSSPEPDHFVALKDLIQELVSKQPVVIGEEADNLPKKNKLKEYDEVQRPKGEEKKKRFLPEYILTDAEPTPTNELITDSPLTEQNQAFVDQIASEQQHETESSKKARSLQILDEVSQQLTKTDLVSRWQKVLASPLTFTKQEKIHFLMANTENNRAFLGLEDELVRLLLQLDSVESSGDQTVRDYRRELVKKCQDILDLLDVHKQNELQLAKNGTVYTGSL